MRRVRFRDAAGATRYGELTGETIRYGEETFDVGDVELLAPVEPTKVLGVGRNYTKQFEDADYDPPTVPRLWWKGSQNVVAGPGTTVTLPSEEVVFEAELGIVVGEQCRNVSAERAPDVIAGYTCVDDLSDQAHVDDPAMFRVKSFDGAAPTGPVVASPDLVPEEPRIRLWVNGEKRQDSADDQMLYSVPEIVAAASAVVTLEPDDVLLTGTPYGFAPLADGDEVAIEIEGVGRLEHDVEIAD